MVLDVLFLILVVLYFIKGYRKGIIVALLSALALIIGFMVALKFSHWLSQLLFNHNSLIAARWAPVITFAVILLLVILLMRFVANIISRVVKAVLLGWLNKWCGGLLYVLIVAFFVSTLLWLGDKVNIINNTTKQSSITYPVIAPIAPQVFSLAGALFPFVRSSWEGLNHTLDNINTQLQTHVGTH